MIDELRPLVKDVVIAIPSTGALAQRARGMFYPPTQERAALEMLGVECHREAAQSLIPKLRDHLFTL